MSCGSLSSRFPASSTVTWNISYSLVVPAVLQGFSMGLTCQRNGYVGDAAARCLWGRWGMLGGFCHRCLSPSPAVGPEDFSDWMVTVILRTCSALWVDVGLRTKSAGSA